MDRAVRAVIAGVGRPRLTPEELDRRRAYALELLRAGVTRREVAIRAKLEGCWVKQIGDQNGIPARHRNPSALTDEERARRRAFALKLMRAGVTRKQAQLRARLDSKTIRELADANGIPKGSPGAKAGPRGASLPVALRRDVTRMTFAELDALEAQVAADRAAGRLPPVEDVA